MEHTKGKVKVIQNNKWPFTIDIETENKHILSINMAHYSTADNTIEDVLKRDFTNNSEVIANAELIADAFNTTNESGLKPSELYKQNQELLEALKPFASLSRYYKNTGDKYVIHAWDTNEFGFSSLTVGMLHKAQQAINNAKTK